MEFLPLLLAFLLTLLLEWPSFSLLAGQPLRKTALFVLLLNTTSWPLACVLYQFLDWNLLLTEIIVWIIESAFIYFYWKFPLWKAAGIALLINAFSYFAGSPLSEILSAWISR